MIITAAHLGAALIFAVPGWAVAEEGVEEEAPAVVEGIPDELKEDAPKEEVEGPPEEGAEVVSNGTKFVNTIRLSLGYSTATGNTEKEALAFVVSDKLKWDVYEANFRLSLNYEESEDDAKTVNKGSFFMDIDHDIDDEWALFLFSDTSYDEFRNIDLRESLGVGAKYTFMRERVDGKTRKKASISYAVLYDYEKLEDGTDSEEARSSVRVKYVTPVTANSTFRHVTFYQPAFSDMSDYLIKSETSFAVAMNDKVSLKFTLTDNYDNRPAPGVEQNDLTTTTSLEVSF